MPRTGFTLIEILAVLAVIGLIAGLGLGGLVRLLRSDPIADAVAALRDRGQMARYASSGAAGMTLHLDDRGFTVSPAGRIGDLVLPGPVRLAWTLVERSADTDPAMLAIDDHGRSRDAQVTIASGDRQERWYWSGLTGEWMREDDEQDGLR